MDSSQKEQIEEKNGEESKETNPPPKNNNQKKTTFVSGIENFIYPTTKENLTNLNIKLEIVFKSINKLQTSKPILLIKYPETKFTCDELKDLFIETEEFPLKNLLNLIL